MTGDAPPKYALHKHPVQLDTLKLVRYLHARGTPAPPALIFERGHPRAVTDLPAIRELETGRLHLGARACAEFYARVAGIENVGDLLAAADELAARDPDYRVHA